MLLLVPAYLAGEMTLGEMRMCERALGNTKVAFEYFVNSYRSMTHWRAIMTRLQVFDDIQKNRRRVEQDLKDACIPFVALKKKKFHEEESLSSTRWESEDEDSASEISESILTSYNNTESSALAALKDASPARTSSTSFFGTKKMEKQALLCDESEAEFPKLDSDTTSTLS